MKYALIGVGLVVLLIAIVMGIKYHNDAERLTQDLADQADTLAVVRSELAGVNDSLNSKLEQLRLMAVERDSLTQALALTSQRADRLSFTARQLRASIDSLQGLSDMRQSRIDELSLAVSDIERRLTDTVAALAATRRQLESTSQVVDEQTVLIAQIQPWYAKWKHDATERNWLEKLFGSGKAAAPGYPEPVFPDVTTEELPTDSVAEAQASH